MPMTIFLFLFHFPNGSGTKRLQNDIANHGLSWNFCIADNLESLILQDRPLNAIITHTARQSALG
jgi:hypothetical protein